MSDANETAREAAQALSEGINCIAEIVATLRADPLAPPPSEVVALEAMERALEAASAKEVWSSMALTEEQIEQVHQARRAILEWQATRQPPKELLPLAEGILDSFNL